MPRRWRKRLQNVLHFVRQIRVNHKSITSHVANIGDARSLAIHPATTTHSQLTKEEQLATGVSDGYVRLSVGIEHIDDIVADIKHGLEAASRSLKAA